MPKPSRNRHRQNEALLNLPQLDSGQSVARVIQACGENNYEVETENGTACLYHLPKRLRFVTFVKRGTYVFIRADDTRGIGKVRGDIEAVILDSHLSTLRKQPFWPERFARQQDSARSQPYEQEKQSENDKNQYQSTKELDGSSDEDDPWHVGVGNPNRNAWEHLGLAMQDSDDDDSNSNA